MATPRSLPAAAAVAMLTALAVVPMALHAQEPLPTVRNFQEISPVLSSAGQIGYDQIPLLVDDGYEVVVNLAVADEERNGREGFLVTEAGLAYIHIPVDWEEPTLDDLTLFFEVMQAAEGRKVFVHCFANMRASAFVYLYRTLVLGVSEEEARATMEEVWEPEELEQWADLIRRAQESRRG